MSSKYESDWDRFLYDGSYRPVFDDNHPNGVPTIHQAFVPGHTPVHGHGDDIDYQDVFHQPLPTSETTLYECPSLPQKDYYSITQPINNDSVSNFLDPSIINFQTTAAQQMSPYEFSSKVEASSVDDSRYQQLYPLSMHNELKVQQKAQEELEVLLPGITSYRPSDLLPKLATNQFNGVAHSAEHDLDNDFLPKQSEQAAPHFAQGMAHQTPDRVTTRKSVTPRARSTQTPSKLCSNPGCTRRFRPTGPDKEFCRRHQEKYDRNHAEPPIFRMHPDIKSFEAAFVRVYPEVPALNLEDDDVHNSKAEDEWIADFIQAANKPYEGGGEYDEFYTRQQKVYNGKGFDDEMVNVRMRFLYRAAVTFHEGGIAVYPKGGDNEGYGNADKKLIFSERLNEIVRILELDKRVCMDVIEGRGVTALVANPLKYEKRKTQNKDSNARKQKKQKLGDKVQEMLKAQGRDLEGSEADSEDYIGEEDAVEDGEEQHAAQNVITPAPTPPDQALDGDLDQVHANSGKRKRATRSSTARASDKKSVKRQRTSKEDQGDRGLLGRGDSIRSGEFSNENLKAALNIDFSPDQFDNRENRTHGLSGSY